MPPSKLPEPLNELERCLHCPIGLERERKAKRIASTMDEIRRFYNAVFPRLEVFITYLNQFPYDELPGDARRLCDKNLALVEVCNLVELYRWPDVMDAMDPARFVPYE
jgi:hypothetical protein